MGVLHQALENKVNGEIDLTAVRETKTLVFDIETFPAMVNAWPIYQTKLYSNYVPHEYVTPGGMYAWAAHWLHEPNVVHYADIHSEDFHERLWDMLNEAEFDVTFNGGDAKGGSGGFDHKKLRGFFFKQGLARYSPSKSIDLIKTARTLGLESNSLAYLCRWLDTPHQKLKEETGGASIWKKVLEGDEHARKMTRRYCVGDVRATTDAFLQLLPIIHPAPNLAGWDETVLNCPRCGSLNFTDAGQYATNRLKHNTHRCLNCTGLFYSTRNSKAGIGKAL